MTDQREKWKAESEQLKKDLDSRPKQIVKREVPIRFGEVKPESSKPAANEKPSNSLKQAGPKRTDDFLKRQLGLN